MFRPFDSMPAPLPLPVVTLRFPEVDCEPLQLRLY